jgi:hypothetical protein
MNQIIDLLEEIVANKQLATNIGVFIGQIRQSLVSNGFTNEQAFELIKASVGKNR